MKNNIILIFCLSTLTTIGQNHLEPLDGVLFESDFSYEYYMNIRELLINKMISNKYRQDAEIQLIITPSFTPEKALSIRIDISNQNYVIMYGECDKNIWNSKGDSNTKVKIVEKLISDDDRLLLYKLYEAAINNTRYKTPTVPGNDGTSYYFSKSNWGIQAGKTWSPNKSTIMGDLVEINLKIIEKINENDFETFELSNNLKIKIRKLITEIGSN